MEKKTRIEPALLDTAIQLWKEQDKRHWIPIAGNSMLPLLREGDRVLVAHDCTRIQRGDVIVFWQTNQLIIHRVIQIQRTSDTICFLTKGDNGLSFDPPVREDQVIGKVLAARRDNREISIDTRMWRWLGYGIAYVTWLIRGLLVMGQRIKRRFIGHPPNRWTRRIQQTMAGIPSRLLKFWMAFFDHWKA